MPTKPKSKKSNKRVDASQLSLLDFIAGKPAEPITAAKAKRPRAKRLARDGTAPAIMSPKDAARYLNLSPETLKRWREKRKGPPFTKVGARLIGYEPSDLDAFLTANKRR